MSIERLNNIPQILNPLNFPSDDAQRKEQDMAQAELLFQDDTLELSMQAQKALNQKQPDVWLEAMDVSELSDSKMQTDAQGNRVQISSKGNELASSQGPKVAWDISGQVENASSTLEASKNVLGTAALDSGTKVSIYTTHFADNEEKPNFSGTTEKIMAEITRIDGSTETFEVRGNTVISEDDDGNIMINSEPEKYKTSERFDLNGTNKNDVIINVNGVSNINCGKGNDTIFSFNNIKYLDLGDGNNTIYTPTYHSITSLVSNDGNNILTHCNVGNAQLGSGDNVFNNCVFTNITIGDGHNILNRCDISFKLTAGNGNNKIDISSAHTLQVGDGNNTITIHDRYRGLTFVNGNILKYGNGNNTISANFLSSLEGGDGDNIINGEIYSLSLGNGNNKIEGKTTGSNWNFGNGDNYLNLYDTACGFNFGDGNNTLIIKNVLGGGILTGKGNNSVEFIGDVLGFLVNFGTGNNKFIAYGDVSNLEYHGGKGNDAIEIHGNLKDSQIFSGLGDDKITIYKNIYNSIIRSSSPLSEISVYGEIVDSYVGNP